MARLTTQAFIFEKYGPRLDKHALAEVLGIATGTVMNHVHAGTLGIRTYVSHGKTWADYEQVADYLDSCAQKAKEAA